MPTSKFDKVFRDEYAAIWERNKSLPRKENIAGPATANGLTGLALSGGGIRSASFALGALQALNSRDVLPQIHYLSTVSGGGYIGTAMTVAMSGAVHDFPYDRKKQQQKADDNTTGQNNTLQDAGETLETKHLRDNSRYLVQNGSISILSALVIYLRGIVTNLLIVLPFLLFAAALLVWRMPDTRTLSLGDRWALELWPLSQWPMIAEMSMPLTFAASLIVLILLVIYAVGVSIFPIIPVAGRRKLALCAAIVFSILLITVLYELQCLLLRNSFAGALIAKQPSDGGVLTTLVTGIKTTIGLIVVSLAGVFPFIKQLAASAVAEKDSSVSESLKRWGSRILLFVAAALVPFLLWLMFMQFVFWGIGIADCSVTQEDCSYPEITWKHAPGVFLSLAQLGSDNGNMWPFPIVYLGCGLILFVIALFLNVNSNSLHQLYRDRLGSAFLVQRECTKDENGLPKDEIIVPKDDFKFHKAKTDVAPYHIINAALNVPGSAFANRRGRNAEFFIFSPKYVGSEATGYVNTQSMEETVDGLNIGTAMAISGAAAAPNMGMASMRPLSMTIAFLNVRLGRWLKHPEGIDTIDKTKSYSRWWHGTPGITYLFREALFKSGNDINKNGFLFLTDGGHIENLGVYELLRRKCKVIIAVDGEADPDIEGGSLVQLERFARIDLGITITMDWKGIGKRSRQVGIDVKNRIYDPQSGPHVALGLIGYPGGEEGVLVYLKSSLSGDENDYIMNYKARYPSFPHETTMDQLFSEEQFECYRALGEHIMDGFLTGRDKASPNDPNRANLLKLLTAALPKAKAT